MQLKTALHDVYNTLQYSKYKLARTALAVDSYLLPTSKSRGTKTRTKINNPAPISFRYCALI